ncbi:MAG: CvpA family protein [Phycisphaerales bacterium]|nr:CvpA family protein [Phycisphaerales bacterium]MCI0675884.1 CvpA family protein [Phycisphaerales bacterium]
MFIAFNAIIVLLVLLIAYWWANQGLFSALLHLLCVITAGAIAFAVWEPLTTGLLLRGNGFDNYAWGVSFILVFMITLLILRVSVDKIVGANINIPNWANLAFGLPVGAASGVLTIGIFLIGAGFIQSSRDMMSVVGWARSKQNGQVQQINQLWTPVHAWTYEFYGLLSVGSLYPTFERTPLRSYYPDLDKYAMSLFRDSFKDGRGKVSLRPKDAHIVEAIRCNEAGFNRYAVRVTFEPGARDYGEQLTLSKSQVRLIGEARGTSEAKVAYPDSWTQYDGWHKFDDFSHFASSEPAQSGADMVFQFNATDLGNSRARFIQIRGTRYRLPAVLDVASGRILQLQTSGVAGAMANVTLDTSAVSIQSAIELTNKIPVFVSTNQMPPGFQVTEDKFLSGGDGELQQRGERPSRALLVKGILESKGARIVQVDVSRESTANIFGSVRERAGEDAELLLVDSSGRPYWPVGFIHERSGRTRIKVDFQNYVRKLKDFPALPTSGGQTLKLVFSVTEGSTITGLKCGDVTVGTCSLLAPRIEAPAERTDRVPTETDKPLEGERPPSGVRPPR